MALKRLRNEKNFYDLVVNRFPENIIEIQFPLYYTQNVKLIHNTICKRVIRSARHIKTEGGHP